eukprot:scaffold24321_cov119-Isochrysis_galbana.AAC.4
MPGKRGRLLPPSILPFRGCELGKISCPAASVAGGASMKKKTDYEIGRVRRKRILWDAGIRKAGRPPKASEPLTEE